MGERIRSGASSTVCAANRRGDQSDVQRSDGQAVTLSEVSRRIDHEFAAELGANGLPGWTGAFVPKER